MRSSRPYLILLGCLALVGLWLQAPWGMRSAPVALEAQPTKVTSPRAAQRNGVFATNTGIPTPALPTAPTPAAIPRAANPTPAPFTFLGRIVEDGQTVVLLHRAGRTLKVRGAGKVADDYEVDALLDNFVVLRHLPTATQQVIELAARDLNPLSGEPEDSPRD